jgi:hypothetical protein
MSVDEWDHREVCPDGSCTGVIGAEGLIRCIGSSKRCSINSPQTTVEKYSSA